MNYLLDTNILLSLASAGHPHHSVTQNAVRKLTASGILLFITPQNLTEFWVVATRPLANNGLGLTTSAAAIDIANFRAAFYFAPDQPGIVGEWQRLVVTHNIIGKRAHDARLLAVAKVHSLTHLLTLNGSDFKFAFAEGVTVVDPASV